MRVLLIGSGGREHALAWSLSRSSNLSELFIAPGNPGMSKLGDCVSVPSQDVDGITELATDRRVDLVLIGPEAPLVAGLADALDANGVPTFGPGKSWARLEGSKSFAKALMRDLGIPTASYETFDRSSDAISYVESVGGRVAIKADGLAQGKGVVVCESLDEARRAIIEAIDEQKFGASGSRVVIEERLEGEELSVLAFCDGKTILPMEPAQDFKRAYDGDLGPNTGGMGAYSGVPACTPEVYEEIVGSIFEPLTGAIQRAEDRYVGVIYAGLMLTAEGVKVIEFNCRFGDPETQALLPRLNSDLIEIVSACIDGSLAGSRLSWKPSSCVSVVAASGGYPNQYKTGFEITGIEEAESLPGVAVFHAGSSFDEGRLVTAGGRVLAVSATGETTEVAASRAYQGIARISFDGMTYRTDIARRPMES